MNKEKLITIGKFLAGIVVAILISVFISSYIFQKQAETIIKESNRKLQELKDELEKEILGEKKSDSELAKKDSTDKKEDTTSNKTTTNSSSKKETPKTINASNTNTNTTKQENPDLLKRSRFDSLDMTFWASRLYYVSLNIHDANSVAEDFFNSSNAKSEMYDLNASYQNLKKNYNILNEIERSGIPNICKNQYGQFKNKFAEYIKLYGDMINKQSANYMSPKILNKCTVLLNEIGDIRISMESKLK